MSLRTVVSSSAREPFTTILAPHCARALAIPKPIPEVEPVTIATLPDKLTAPS